MVKVEMLNKLKYGIPNNKDFKGNYIFGFIDILGFKNDIRTNWDAQENNVLSRFRKFSEYINRNVSDQLKRPDKTKSNIFGKCRITNFSDTIIIGYGFEKDPNSTEFIIGLYYVLYATSYIWRKAIETGFTVRGGIEYGKLFWGEKVVIGPVLLSAYEIESSISIWSRIVLGDDIVAKLRTTLQQQKYDYKNHTRSFHYTVEGKLKNFLIKFEDCRFGVSPHVLYSASTLTNVITILENLQKQAPEKCKYKYCPLLNILKNEHSPLDLQSLGVDRRKFISKSNEATPTT